MCHLKSSFSCEMSSPSCVHREEVDICGPSKSISLCKSFCHPDSKNICILFDVSLFSRVQLSWVVRCQPCLRSVVLTGAHDLIRPPRCHLIQPFSLAGVLRVWVHAPRIPDTYNSDRMCYYCGDVLSVECWELPLAMDVIHLRSINSCLCVPLLYLLLFCEDKDDWLLPNLFLLWLHSYALSWTWHPLW